MAESASAVAQRLRGQEGSSPPGSLLLLGRPPLVRAAGAGLGGAGAGSSAGSRGALPHVPRADAALLRAVTGRAVLLRRSPAPRSDRLPTCLLYTSDAADE